jgi:hypothetical protein
MPLSLLSSQQIVLLPTWPAKLVVKEPLVNTILIKASKAGTASMAELLVCT